MCICFCVFLVAKKFFVWFVCVFVCVFVHMCAHVCEYMYMCVYMCVNMYICACIHMCLCARCVFFCLCVHLLTYLFGMVVIFMTLRIVVKICYKHVLVSACVCAQGWKRYVSNSTGKPYYYNKATKETRWEPPGPDD